MARKKTRFVIIEDWMMEELGLTGNEVIAYAIIYGFSKEKGQYFTASQAYLEKRMNLPRRTIQRLLERLTSNGYICKKDIFVNNVKYCQYCALKGPEDEDEGSDKLSGSDKMSGSDIMSQGVATKCRRGSDKMSPEGSDKMSPNNKAENKGESKEEKKNIYMSSSDENDGVSLSETSAVPNDLPKKKEKKASKQKEKDSETHKAVEECLEVLNSLTGSKYKPTTKSTIKDVGGRLNDGYTVEDICNTFRFQCDQWKGTEFERFLTPATLLRQSNFERYYNEMSKSKKKERPKRITYEGRTYEWDDWDHEYVPLYDHTWDGVNP